MAPNHGSADHYLFATTGLFIVSLTKHFLKFKFNTEIRIWILFVFRTGRYAIVPLKKTNTSATTLVLSNLILKKNTILSELCSKFYINSELNPDLQHTKVKSRLLNCLLMFIIAVFPIS